MALANPTHTTLLPHGERLAWHALDIEETARILASGPLGLTRSEVQTRQERYGPNQLEEAKPPSALAVLLHQFRNPLIYILMLAAAVTLFLGDFIDAGVIAAVLLLNAVVGFTQESKAEKAARSLMQLLAPQARVLRDGREQVVESRELVPGDLVLLESGVRVPADLRLLSVTALQVEEAPLTGESLPVTKTVTPLRPEVQPADRTNLVYAGTTVTSGRGRGYVVATGAATELGTIAAHVQQAERPETPLQQRMHVFARRVGLVVAAAAALAFAIGIFRGESPAEMLMVAVGLAVAAIPEGLPIVSTITLAVGVQRMARRRAIVRRLPAVETLGSTTIIGSDKTGTLTENRMTVRKLWTPQGEVSVAGDDSPGCGDAANEHHPLRMALLTGVLTNEATLRQIHGDYETGGDPTEAALLVAAARLGVAPGEVRAAYPAVAEIPFEPERQYSASFRVVGEAHQVFVKGAPERVLAMCDQMLTAGGPVPLREEEVHDAARRLASEGLRVLAMACGSVPHASAEQAEMPGSLTFVGLQGMLDPPRSGVREAIAGCREAGIRVLMITGDHADTAQAIGCELGIAEPGAPVLTGVELDCMDEEALRRRVRDVPVYARVTPEHKLRVVRALQSHGEVVAVTGDGVNDAPALKAADIGVAMGKSGTDVAREASDLILADDNFASIYAAVEEGRITFDNLRKATFFLVSTGVAAILAILSTQILGWPLPFLPAQLLWLNLVTNGLQDLALAFEPGERDVLQRSPRPPREGIVSPLLWERTAVAGLVMAVGTLFLFRWELDQSGSLARAQTVALTTMVLFQNFHAGNARSEFLSGFRLSPVSNPFLFLAVIAALLVHVAALHLPFTQFILRVEPLDAQAWVRMVLTAVSIVGVVELHKLLRGRRGHRMDGPSAAWSFLSVRSQAGRRDVIR